MSSPPHLFDRASGRQRLARARRLGPADFLLDRAVAEMLERLEAVKTTFERIADIGTPSHLLATALQRRSQAESVTRLAPIRDEAARILTAIGDPETLPLRGGSFDLIASALSLQAINDLPGALVQIRRTLMPGGLFLACLTGGATLTELRTALAEAETEITGGISPRVFPFADLRDMGALLQRTGFVLPVTDTDVVTVRYASMFGLCADLRAMGATNILAARFRRPTRRAVFRRAAEIYAERFADPDGRVRATFEIVFLSGWAPSGEAAKPLGARRVIQQGEG